MKSKVWDYMTKTDSKQVECNICNTALSYKDGSTTILARHLFRAHQIDTAISNTGLKRQSASSVNTLSGFLQKKQKLEPSSTRHKEITELIMGMITKDIQPFSLVEDRGFRALTTYLEPRYVIPSRKTFRDQILPGKYAQVRQKLLNLLSRFTFFSITTDGWTSREATSYLTYTVHLIDKEFTMHSFQLGTYEVTESHTASTLANHLLSTCKKWGIIPNAADNAIATVAESAEDNDDESDQTHPVDGGQDSIDLDYYESDAISVPSNVKIFVTTDNASNISAAVRETKLPHVRCFAHTINLAVQKCIKEFQAPLARIRKIVSFFHRSSLGSVALKVRIIIILFQY